jgi:RimJ/RimL family protein N-acetyltransferase/predicted GNAT family acetyltransferase
MTSDTQLQVITNPISAQFEAVRGGDVVGLLAYDKIGSHFDLRHTFVPVEFRGEHIANHLVTDVLNQIRSIGGTVAPSCSYVAAFVERHPHYADLVDQNPPRKLPTALTGPSRNNGQSSAGPAQSDTINVYPDSIVTERLTLRPWTLDDTDEAFHIYGDARVAQWTRPFIGSVSSHDMMRRLLDNWIRQSDRLRPPQGRWAVELKDSTTLVGGAHLLDLPAGTGSRLVMSWELAAFATGNGFAAEAGHGLVHSAFSMDASLDAVYSLAHPDNSAAVATLGRIGLRALPGAERHHAADLALYAISRSTFDSIEEQR